MITRRTPRELPRSRRSMSIRLAGVRFLCAREYGCTYLAFLKSETPPSRLTSCRLCLLDASSLPQRPGPSRDQCRSASIRSRRFQEFIPHLIKHLVSGPAVTSQDDRYPGIDSHCYPHLFAVCGGGEPTTFETPDSRAREVAVPGGTGR